MSIGKAIVLIVSIAVAPPLLPAPAADSALAPAALAIYYGYPSLVNGADGDVELAAAVFAAYGVVVFGDGLQFGDVDPKRQPAGAGPHEHRRTRAIIERLRATAPAMEIYGYIDLGNSQRLSMGELQQRSRLWAEMGVTGIFLDEAGYEFGVTRARQNVMVDFIHSLGLTAFLNAFDPDDVFGSAPVPLNVAGGGNRSGTPPRLNAKDAYLLESFQVRLGQVESWPAWSARTAKAVRYRDRYGTRIFAVTTTTSETEAPVAQLFRYAWWSAALWGLDGFGWGEPDFSGASSRLPDRHALIDRRSVAGTRFTTAVMPTADGLERHTDAGVVRLNRASRSGRFIPRR